MKIKNVFSLMFAAGLMMTAGCSQLTKPKTPDFLSVRPLCFHSSGYEELPSDNLRNQTNAVLPLYPPSRVYAGAITNQ